MDQRLCFHVRALRDSLLGHCCCSAGVGWGTGLRALVEVGPVHGHVRCCFGHPLPPPGFCFFPRPVFPPPPQYFTPRPRFLPGLPPRFKTRPRLLFVGERTACPLLGTLAEPLVRPC